MKIMQSHTPTNQPRAIFDRSLSLFRYVPLLAAITFATNHCNAQNGSLQIGDGFSIAQDFNSIGNSATAQLPTGFTVSTNASARTISPVATTSLTAQRGAANISSSATSGIYNFASGTGDGTTAAETDRAIGFISASSSNRTGNLYVTLNSATAISALNIAFNVEKYRNGSNAAGFTTQLNYSTDGTNFTSAGTLFTTNFVADATTVGVTPAPSTTTAVSGTFTLPAALASGTTFYLDLEYSVTSGTSGSNAQALGFDDLSISTVPEPTTILGGLLLVAGGAWSLRRRWQAIGLTGSRRQF